jgi:hypothetical protein
MDRVLTLQNSNEVRYQQVIKLPRILEGFEHNALSSSNFGALMQCEDASEIRM